MKLRGTMGIRRMRRRKGGGRAKEEEDGELEGRASEMVQE